MMAESESVETSSENVAEDVNDKSGGKTKKNRNGEIEHNMITKNSDVATEIYSFDLMRHETDETITHDKANTIEMARSAELKSLIAHCKRFQILFLQNTSNNKFQDDELSFDRVQMMEKLVQYQLELDYVKEELVDPFKKARSLLTVSVRGHKFSLQSATGRNPYCEVCLSTIWRFLQCYYRCNYCGLRSHGKCVRNVLRYCAGAKVSNILFRPRTEICKERGLDFQGYKCAECHHSLQFDSEADSEPRLCDYNGHYYCPRCHWNDECFIPARIIHNWDFHKYKVCRASKQLLVVIERKPLFNICTLNPAMVNHIDQLDRISLLRRNILLMKNYFLCCKEACDQRILQALRHRQHFVENSGMYSLVDLVDLYQGRLLPEIEVIIGIFTEHITKDCSTCKGKGFFCELCDGTATIFPFSENVTLCHDCSAAFHKECFERNSKHCPRCLRRKSRTS
ncbi:unnamed protein product [Thelazia callipaeda]|uniref:Phorbol-ester/DAG-type domain-containing protein n=1 Tax=Thelazia callipaeda TaxID=103827 RepID=A0A0N5D8W4_THECL|nr:unnamed protein product [Thelazia callipaeda]